MKVKGVSMKSVFTSSAGRNHELDKKSTCTMRSTVMS
jgi:hypothetical protein